MGGLSDRPINKVAPVTTIQENSNEFTLFSNGVVVHLFINGAKVIDQKQLDASKHIRYNLFFIVLLGALPLADY